MLPQQDQCSFPGCPLWPWPQPRKPPERQTQRDQLTSRQRLISTDRPAHRRTWHGSRAAAASLFGPSAGAEAAAVKGSAVAPQLPGHRQRKRRPLRDEARETRRAVIARRPPGGRGRSWFQKMLKVFRRRTWTCWALTHTHAEYAPASWGVYETL